MKTAPRGKRRREIPDAEWRHTFQLLGGTPEIAWKHWKGVEARCIASEARDAEITSLRDKIKEIYNLAAFDWDSMPESSRKNFHQIIKQVTAP